MIVAGASSHPGQVRVRRAAQHPAARVRRARCSPPTSTRRRSDPRRHRARRRSRRARRCGRPRVRVHARSSVNVDVLRDCARQGVRAAFVMTGGYAETGDAGRARRARAGRRRRRALGLLLAGPNGQGIVSTPSSLCAQMVAPYPPRGPDRRREPVRQHRVERREPRAQHRDRHQPRRVRGQRGGGRGGRLPRVTSPTTRPPTVSSPTSKASTTAARCSSALRRCRERAARSCWCRAEPRAEGGRAAASHTGALATDDRIFTGMCRQAGRQPRRHRGRGLRRGGDVRHPAAPARARTSRCSPPRAAGACSPPTRSPARAVACSSFPTTSSRRSTPCSRRDGAGRNPIDLAAAETRDTIPQMLELLAAHARSTRCSSSDRRAVEPGPAACAPARSRRGHGLERIIEFHERQDERYAQVAADVSAASGKPIAVCHRAGGERPRQPRAARGARDRSLLRCRPPIAPSPRSSTSGVRARFLARRRAHDHRPPVDRRRSRDRRRRRGRCSRSPTTRHASGADTGRARGATPIWSARRVPQPIVDAVGGQRLQTRARRRSGGRRRASSWRTTARSWPATTPTRR